MTSGIETFLGLETIHRWTVPNIWIGPDQRFFIGKKDFRFTVKFLNFGTRENFAVIYQIFNQRSQILGYFIKKDANGFANSLDPDQTLLGILVLY